MINLSELLPDSEIASTDLEDLPEVKAPKWFGAGCQVSQREYALQVPGVGSYYAADGHRVFFHAQPGADPKWVRLYLNSQVLVALLHQRKIINFHASSFIYNRLGVMVLGETGAGKSSLTLAFALQDGGFLTDDLTPVVFEGPAPMIMPLHRNVKLRKDTAAQLGIDHRQLTDAESGTGKKYYSLQPVQYSPYPLHIILLVNPSEIASPAFTTPPPAERFALLRSEVCSWEILAGMPETEASYMQQLAATVQDTEFIRIERPAEISINDLFVSVKACLNGIQDRGEN